MSKLTNKIIALLLIIFVVSCQKETTTTSKGTYAESGSAIIINEGAFGSNNGSVSFVDRNGNVTNNIFELANNGSPLGDVINSYTIVGDKGIICVNNSGKIEIVDTKTFKRIATITDVVKTNYVRYAIGVENNKAYFTNGSIAGIVGVIDLTTNTIAKTITVDNGPEQMTLANNKVYVCNSGGWGNDGNTISVINTNTDEIETTITVGDIPTYIVKDALGYLWVLCTGKPNATWTEKASKAELIRINPNNNSIDKRFTLLNLGDANDEMKLTIGNNGGTIYYAIANKVYALGINSTSLPSNTLINTKGVHGLSASPYNNQIWTMPANFSTGSWVYRYASTGILIDSLKVGIGPNGVVFNL